MGSILKLDLLFILFYSWIKLLASGTPISCFLLSILGSYTFIVLPSLIKVNFTRRDSFVKRLELRKRKVTFCTQTVLIIVSE